MRRYVEASRVDPIQAEWTLTVATPVVLFLVLLTPIAKFPMMLLAGGHLLVTAVVGGFTGLVRALSDAEPGEVWTVWTQAVAHGLLPLLVALIAKQNGPYGAALVERRKASQAVPGHRRLSNDGKLLLTLCAGAPLLLLLLSGNDGFYLVMAAVGALAIILIFLAVLLVKAVRDAWKPKRELPMAARRISVQDRIRDQPNIRHQYRVGGD
ncbi:hypothetical protein ABI59_15470 [Acidobacteria bacterium Mor1]|nr:hypothetical protein ABI59_15470 [Acidobacteria bacterium Mor1]